MTVVSVSFDGTYLSYAESETDGGTWDQWGATQSPTQETDFVWQGANAISEKVSATTGGIDFDATTAIDYTSATAVRYVLAKCMVSTTGAIDYTVAEGLSYQVGSSGSDYYNYYLAGLYAGDYPVIRGGWIMLAIDPNEVAFRDAITGTPVLTAIDYYGFYVDMSGSAKAENIIHDRLDYIPVGGGATLTAGTGTDPEGTFQDFVDADQGNRARTSAPYGGYGVFVTGEAEIIVTGVATIASATATEFDDSNAVLAFPYARLGEGSLGVDVDLQNASTVVSMTACVFKGLGYISTKKFFDTSLEINATTDVITIASHGFSTGDYVLYSNEGGTDAIGLTSGTYYFVRAVSADTLAFYAVGATVGRQNSLTDTTRLALTQATAPGENHSIIRDPDNRPDYTASGTSGSATWTSCSFDSARVITFTSACVVTGGFIIGAGNVVLSTAQMSSVTISGQTTTEGEALFTPLATLGTQAGTLYLEDCTFESGDEGHAIEITSTGTMDSVGHTFTNYWSPTDTGWNFHTQTGVEPTTDVITTDAAHGFTTGDAVYYNNEGGTDTVGLTNGSKYYVDVASTTTFTVHATKAAAVAGSSLIALSDGSSGETHSIYSANAAVFNDSAGSVTINVLSGDAPSIRNGTSATTTVSQSVTLAVTVIDSSGDPIVGARVAIYTDDDNETQLMNELTLSGGLASESYAYTTDQAVFARVRAVTGFTPPYLDVETNGTITASGLTATITLAEDNILTP